MLRGGPLPVLWLFFLAGFVALSGFAAVYDRFPTDIWLAHRLQDIDATAFVRALDWAEDLGDAPLWVAVWLVGVAILAATARRWEASLLLISGLGRPLNAAIKEIVARPRPSEEFVVDREAASGFGFPSGHADAALVLYGLLFYFITTSVRPVVPRTLGQAACVWVIAFTGIERVWQGAHWPSDVLGGFYLGALIVAVLIAVHRLILAAR